MSPKQRKFVDEYLKCFNATEAARRAGYKGNGKTLAVVGHENLRKPKLAKEIQAHLTESAMSADEALQRLGEMARADLGDFADVNQRRDLEHHPKSHLIKKLVVTTSRTGGRTVTKTEDGVSTSTEFKGKLQHKLHIELYDAQKAVVDILKEHGRFVQKVEQTTIDLSKATDEQLKRIANGEHPATVMADTSSS